MNSTVPDIYRSTDGRAAVLRWYDAQLAALPPAVDAVYIETPAGQTHVVAAGPPEAPPVIVLHGMNMNAAMMGEAVRALSGAFRVFAIDIIGMPGKSAGTRPSRRGDGYPRWLEAVMQGLGVASAGFVGVSFGGWLTLRLAAMAPSRVRAAALLGTGGLAPFTVTGQIRAGLAALRYMRRPTSANALSAAKPFFAPGVEPEPRVMEMLALGYRHTRLDIDPRGLPLLSDEALSRIGCPIFVSYGEHDVFFNVDRALARARAVLPRLTAGEVIAGEGHVLTPAAERRLYSKVSSLLRDHTAR